MMKLIEYKKRSIYCYMYSVFILIFFTYLLESQI